MAPSARRGRPPGLRPLSNPGDDKGSVTSSKRSAANLSDEDTPATHKKAATALSKKKAAAFYTGIETPVSLPRPGQRQSPAESLAKTVAPSSPSNLFKATNLFRTDFNRAVVSLRTLSSCFC
ncbi:hypothetical protein K504DRAFT_467077 [Pleomassaria siparia CBS 279.74]|uniref:Uncharacterized protein n=1 Tax=Pleomassaria siparia CBS 279.74 TaxID=1314801 RepID=A0A6G1JPJ8_9PLEO|nr:hypothetical protein K504DRAFT_467077 [Pleomassaria siparia CBS 279.74]